MMRSCSGSVLSALLALVALQNDAALVSSLCFVMSARRQALRFQWEELQ
jgi:hypothetical protein